MRRLAENRTSELPLNASRNAKSSLQEVNLCRFFPTVAPDPHWGIHIKPELSLCRKWAKTGNVKFCLKAATVCPVTAAGHPTPRQLSTPAHNSQPPHFNQQASNTYLIAWYSSLCESLITVVLFVFAFIPLNRCQTASCSFCHTSCPSFSCVAAAYLPFQVNFVLCIAFALNTL